MKIFIVPSGNGYVCVNSDNKESDKIYLKQGARQLSEKEIEKAGMTGYESYVSPLNTVVNKDGTVKFTPPKEDEQKNFLFTTLRMARNDRLTATDYMMCVDFPISEKQLENVKAYRQALRDLPEQDGAPWDGGGKKTPWPVLS